MSKYIFGSNQISKRRINKMNNFEIELSPVIDARNAGKEIIVDEIIYLNSISSIHMRNLTKIEISIEDFLRKANGTKLKRSMKFSHEATYDLMNNLNKTLNKFNVNVNRTVGSKSHFIFSKRWNYDSTFTNLTSDPWTTTMNFRSNDGGSDKFKIKLNIEFGSLLSHTLGFDGNMLVFENKLNEKSDDIMIFNSPYVVDPLFGLNFMIISCDKIQATQMGYVYKPILSIVPIQLDTEKKMKFLDFLLLITAEN